VTAFERRERKGVLYLRWRAANARGVRNWEYESLGKPLRTA
jgi:hypothetical protein